MNIGKIRFWNDDKGYGFISPDNGGKDVFLHIKSFKRHSRRPEIGQRISYKTIIDNKNSLRAVNARYMDRKSSPSFHFNIATLAVIATIIFLIDISLAACTGKISRYTAPVYFVASIVTFIAYAIDKSSAKKSGQRISENTLHLFALVGGWPGAIFAQQTFHHKTKKKSFRSVFWVTVILNCSGLFLFSRPDSGQIAINVIDKILNG
jgi:uncharacterized membrane protein YsdA (DUF1294 family)/cold shock CspA family protein